MILGAAPISGASQPNTSRKNVMADELHPYEPLTSENTALVLIDHQVGLMTGVRDYSTGELKHNVVALAKAAKALKLPIVVTTTARDSLWGPTFPELVAALPGVQIIDRSSVNAFDDAKVARAIEATGRKKLIMTALWTEVCLAYPSLDAMRNGFEVYPVVDAVGGTSAEAHRAGLARIFQAGAQPISWVSLACELQRDWARTETVADVVDIVLTSRLMKGL